MTTERRIDPGGALVDEAEELVRSAQFASTSMLQRKMKLGLVQAEQVLEALVARGVVTPADGFKPRDVLRPPMTLEESMRESRRRAARATPKPRDRAERIVELLHAADASLCSIPHGQYESYNPHRQERAVQLMRDALARTEG